ncbi:putative phage abortive infection protein [Chryseobacterium sp. IT-36CA2]|uniref:putative phage abortive infection protein n=1 Tax=Chryseobacterium sp. IT-36CA2 TaxID=3026460 RepID=UPI0039E07F95
MKAILWIIAIFLTISGLIISFVFFKSLYLEYTFGENPILLPETGQVGDFIGGVVGTIFSLAGFIILLMTFNSQTKSTYLEQLESKVFELIKLHRDNVSEINIKRKIIDNNGEITEIEFPNRRAFKVMVSDFISCRNELNPFMNLYSTDEIYESDYLAETISILGVDKEHIRIKSYARINLSYCIIFYGVSGEGCIILKNLFKKKFKNEFIEELLLYITMKPIESSKQWGKWKKLKELKIVERITEIKKIIEFRKLDPSESIAYEYFYDNAYIKFYGGHQHRLGHYYRHLYQSIKYINSQKKLNFEEKYFYVKTFRAQLSTYEQELLFLNSLSFLGLTWELKPKYKKSGITFININREKSLKLITNYNLIKNVPGSHLFGINFKDYYPKVKYENEE